MDVYESLSHTKWECKYHVVFIPKYRRKALYGELRQHLGEVFRNLAKQKECMIGRSYHARKRVPKNQRLTPIFRFPGYAVAVVLRGRLEARSAAGRRKPAHWPVGGGPKALVISVVYGVVGKPPSFARNWV